MKAKQYLKNNEEKLIEFVTNFNFLIITATDETIINIILQTNSTIEY